MRRSASAVTANPVLVGAVTTLIVIVAVFLAYNANKGLPFVPTTQLKFHSTNGANLLPGNEVREGGHRIGIVEDMRPRRLPDGTIGAEVRLKLDQVAGKIPKDSTLNLRPRSALGLKYVEVTRGRSKETFADGALLPADQVTFPVELEDFQRIWDEGTRDAVRENLKGYGNAFSSRGPSLNQTISELPRLLGHLEPVMSSLANENTQLARFFRELGDFMRVVAPEADRYASGFRFGSQVFEAWSRYPDRLRGTIERSAPTMRTGIRSFRVQRPFLTDLTAMNRSLARAAATLPRTLPRITPALREGIPVLRRQGEVNDRLREVMDALDRLMNDPATPTALRGVDRLVDILNPAVRFIGPYVTVCNYFNYAWTNVSEHLTEPDPTGYSQRTLLNQAPRPRNPSDPSMGSIGARRPSNGEEVVSGAKAHLHTNVYGSAVTHDGKADCESGQRGYLEKLTAYNNDPNLKIVTDPKIPGAQGPTYTGRPEVPEGQTFTRLPQTGPLMPRELDR
jgi:ABC-type transporter Mla subunit MlaD